MHPEALAADQSDITDAKSDAEQRNGKHSIIGKSPGKRHNLPKNPASVRCLPLGERQVEAKGGNQEDQQKQDTAQQTDIAVSVDGPFHGGAQKNIHSGNGSQIHGTEEQGQTL